MDRSPHGKPCHRPPRQTVLFITRRMNKLRLPPMGRKIVSADSTDVPMDEHRLPEATPMSQSPAIEDLPGEKSRILKRLLAIIGEHSISAERVGIKLSPAHLELVFAALRAHARSGSTPDFQRRDEIDRNVLDSLFSELVEEPSNHLLTTCTGPDTVRYDAMPPDFWCECIELTEKTLRS